MRRRPRPVIPGQRCPAERGNSANDPKVKITNVGRHHREGVRVCPRCGATVTVRQNWGEKQSAWHYDLHTVPDTTSK